MPDNADWVGLERRRLAVQIAYSLRELFEWDTALYPAEESLTYSSAKQARQAAQAREAQRREALEATPNKLLPQLPCLRLNPATQPEQVEIKVTGSVFYQLHPDFINPIELVPAYARLKYSEKLVIVYRLGLGYTWVAIGEILYSKQTTITESKRKQVAKIYRRAMNKLVLALAERAELSEEAG